MPTNTAPIPVADDLHKEVCEDVKAALSEKKFGVGVGFTLPLTVALPFIERAAQTAVDLAVASYGPQFNEVVQSERDLLRTVLSQQSLEFLTGVIRGLEDAKPGA